MTLAYLAALVIGLALSPAASSSFAQPRDASHGTPRSLRFENRFRRAVLSAHGISVGEVIDTESSGGLWEPVEYTVRVEFDLLRDDASDEPLIFRRGLGSHNPRWLQKGWLYVLLWTECGDGSRVLTDNFLGLFRFEAPDSVDFGSGPWGSATVPYAALRDSIEAVLERGTISSLTGRSDLVLEATVREVRRLEIEVDPERILHVSPGIDPPRASFTFGKLFSYNEPWYPEPGDRVLVFLKRTAFGWFLTTTGSSCRPVVDGLVGTGFDSWECRRRDLDTARHRFLSIEEAVEQIRLTAP